MPTTAHQSDDQSIVIGGIYDHCSGTSYQVNAVVVRAENYEQTGVLTEDVLYTQLTDGEVNPAGTQYTRSKREFLTGVTEINGRKVPIFTFRSS